MDGAGAEAGLRCESLGVTPMHIDTHGLLFSVRDPYSWLGRGGCVGEGASLNVWWGSTLIGWNVGRDWRLR